MFKKTGALLAALTMVLLLPAALAAGTPSASSAAIRAEETHAPLSTNIPEVTEGEEAEYKEGAAGKEVPFEGHIAPRVLSAVVPCEVDFNIYLGAETELELGNGSELFLTKIVNPSAAMIRNTSAVPIAVSVAGVEVKGMLIEGEEPQKGEKFRLVDKLREVQATPYTALLVMGRAGQAFADKADFESQALMTTREEPMTLVESLGADQEEQLCFYGKIMNKATQNYSFQIAVTLRIEPAT